MATGNQAQAEGAVGEKQASDDLYMLILNELQRVNSRLNEVEDKVDRRRQYDTSSNDLQKLSRSVHSCTSKSSSECRKNSHKRIMSDSSSDEDGVPCLSYFKVIPICTKESSWQNCGN